MARCNTAALSCPPFFATHGKTVLSVTPNYGPSSQGLDDIFGRTSAWARCARSIVSEVRATLAFVPKSSTRDSILRHAEILERSSSGVVAAVNRWAIVHGEHCTGSKFWVYALESMVELIHAHVSKVILVNIHLSHLLDCQALWSLDLDNPTIAAELRRLSHAVRSIVDTLKKITGTFLITDSDYDRFCNVFRNDAHIGKERVA